MNIFDFAMQMELDQKHFYLELAENLSDRGMKRILEMLADDEERHYMAVKEMKDGNPVLADTEILQNAKTIFAGMNESGEVVDIPGDQAELLRKAQGIEEKSERFYMEKAEEVEETRQKELLMRLADEEKKHYFLLENLIEFISRPETWLENAEFNHLDEY